MLYNPWCHDRCVVKNIFRQNERYSGPLDSVNPGFTGFTKPSRERKIRLFEYYVSLRKYSSQWKIYLCVTVCVHTGGLWLWLLCVCVHTGENHTHTFFLIISLRFSFCVCAVCLSWEHMFADWGGYTLHTLCNSMTYYVKYMARARAYDLVCLYIQCVHIYICGHMRAPMFWCVRRRTERQKDKAGLQAGFCFWKEIGENGVFKTFI